MDDTTGDITPATPVLGLVSSQNPADVTVGVSFTATASGVADLPTGTVQFTTNGVNLGDAVALNSGVAVSLTTNFARGTNLVTAIYSGDANYASVTNTLEQVSTNLPPVAATVTLDPARTGTSLTIALSRIWRPTGATRTVTR